MNNAGKEKQNAEFREICDEEAEALNEIEEDVPTTLVPRLEAGREKPQILGSPAFLKETDNAH